jgi:hypothetical protein
MAAVGSLKNANKLLGTHKYVNYSAETDNNRRCSE